MYFHRASFSGLLTTVYATINLNFATVGHKLASCIPSSSPDHDFSTFLDPPVQSSFYFDPFVPAEVEDEIKVLPNNKAYGLYSCPVSILKLSSHITSQPLAQIFNVSVSSGSFPAKLKTAKVVPFFKSGDESKPGNYRPISLLSIFRLIKFVNKHNSGAPRARKARARGRSPIAK